MADAELKPCPFCGGAVELERTTGSYEKMHGQREWWGVVCRNTINVGGTCAIQQVPSASKEAAVERWNCRATHPTEAGAPTAAADNLHSAIMNLPNGKEFANFEGHPNTRLAYKIGHRDARHAAAELVNEYASGRESAAVACIEAIAKLDTRKDTVESCKAVAQRWLRENPAGRESAAPAVAGFTTAPIYPTKEMIEAAENTGDLYRMGSPNLWADVWCNMLRAAPAAPVREGDREQDAKGWSQEPPTEQGEYWHWNGDEDTAPYIYHILWSGTAKKCFVSIGQYGITEASFCDEFGGWWKKITQPSVPLNAAMQKGANNG